MSAFPEASGALGLMGPLAIENAGDASRYRCLFEHHASLWRCSGDALSLDSSLREMNEFRLIQGCALFKTPCDTHDPLLGCCCCCDNETLWSCTQNTSSRRTLLILRHYPGGETNALCWSLVNFRFMDSRQRRLELLSAAFLELRK